MNRCQLPLRTLARGGSHTGLSSRPPVCARWPRTALFHRYQSQNAGSDNDTPPTDATELDQTTHDVAQAAPIRFYIGPDRSSTGRRLERWLQPRMMPKAESGRERVRDGTTLSNAIAVVKTDLAMLYDGDAATTDYIMGVSEQESPPVDELAEYAWRTKRSERKQLYNMRPNFHNRELHGRGLRESGATREWPEALTRDMMHSIGVWQQNDAWRKGINKLSRMYDKRYPDLYLKDARDSVRLPDHAERYVAGFFAELDAVKDVLPYFIPPGRVRMTRVLRWECIALWLLVKEPARMITFLNATIILPNRSKRHFQQSIKYLVGHYFHSDAPDREARLVELAHLIIRLSATERFRWSESTFNSLIKACPPEVVEQLFEGLRDHYVVLHFHTWVAFASHLVENGRFEKALQALFYARRAGAKLETESFVWTASAILRRSIRMPDGLRVCLRLTDHLSKSGLPMTTTISNILILNSVEADDLNTALSLYNSMAENGPSRDAYTFAAMLKACKKNPGDADLLNAVIRDAIDAGCVMTEPVVASEIIHCLIRHHTASNPTGAFEIVGDAYAELFDLRPLHDLGIFTHKTQVGEKMPPDRHVLGMILWAFLEYLHVNQISATSAQRLYSAWRGLMAEGRKPFADLAEDSYCYNAFIYYYARHEEGLLAATQVVKDMQQAAGQHNGQLHRGPDATTWSLLVFAYVRRGKTRLAEQIVAYMRGKAIAPQLATWNELLTAYAGRQDLEAVLDTLRRLEAMGLTWDRYTRAALTRFHDKERLISTLERELPPREGAEEEEDADAPLGRRIDPTTFELVHPETGKPLLRKHHSSNPQIFDQTAKDRDVVAGSDDGEALSERPTKREEQPVMIRRHVTAPVVPVRRILTDESGPATETGVPLVQGVPPSDLQISGTTTKAGDAEISSAVVESPPNRAAELTVPPLGIRKISSSPVRRVSSAQSGIDVGTQSA